MVCAIVPAHAQTRFQWPRARVDISKYSSIEMCMAAVRRVHDSVKARGGVLLDTLPLTQYGNTSPLPTIVVETAQQCVERFPEERIQSHEVALAQELYTIANRDDDVLHLLRQHMAVAHDNRERAAAIDTTVIILLKAQPVRLVTADSLLGELDRFDVWPITQKLQRFGNMAYQSRVAGDSVRMRRYSERFLSIAKTLPDSVINSVDGIVVRIFVSVIVGWLNQRELLDSLRQNTTAYANLKRSYFESIAGRGRFNSPVGAQAPPFHADFWRPDHPETNVVPTPGKLTLMIGIPNNYQTSSFGLGQYAVIQRIARRFPMIDVIAVTSTVGFFGPLVPPPPQEEADLLYRDVVELNQLPARLGVVNTQFWRLPNPDRRRINQERESSADYKAVYDLLFTGGGTALLIDGQGFVVDTQLLRREAEPEIIQLIEAVLARS